MAKHAKLIAALEEAIVAYVAEGKSAFPRDQKMQEVYQMDEAALRRVLDFIRKDQIAAAHAAAWKLDSVPRDVIPPRVWKALEKAHAL